jgi:predicted secreted Zn-dependent protease
MRQLGPGMMLFSVGCGSTTIVVPAPPPPVPAVALTASGRAVLALASKTPPSDPNLVVKDDTTRYPIRGSTVAEIAQQLGLGHGDSGSDYVGATAAQVEWQFAQQRHEDTCAITEILVTLQVQTRLPEWVRPPSVSVMLEREWKAFLEANERHENGHRNIALHTASAIARSLAEEHGLPCVELDQLANASARAQWELGHQHQLDYDAATLHGQTQGVRWPPTVEGPNGELQ